MGNRRFVCTAVAASAWLVSERVIRTNFVELLKVRRAAIDGTRASARCWRVIPRESPSPRPRKTGWKSENCADVVGNTTLRGHSGARCNGEERNDEPVIVFFLRLPGREATRVRQRHNDDA